MRNTADSERIVLFLDLEIVNRYLDAATGINQDVRVDDEFSLAGHATHAGELRAPMPYYPSYRRDPATSQ